MGCASCPKSNPSSPPWFEVGIKVNLELANLTRQTDGHILAWPQVAEGTFHFDTGFHLVYLKIANPANKQTNKQKQLWFFFTLLLQMHLSLLIPLLNIPTELEDLRASKIPHAMAKVAKGWGQNIQVKAFPINHTVIPTTRGSRGEWIPARRVPSWWQCHTGLQMHHYRTSISPALVTSNVL